MRKLKAIWKIICAEHFYLITANQELQCEDMQSNSDNYTIASFIKLYWDLFYKSVYLSKEGNKE